VTANNAPPDLSLHPVAKPCVKACFVAGEREGIILGGKVEWEQVKTLIE